MTSNNFPLSPDYASTAWQNFAKDLPATHRLNLANRAGYLSAVNTTMGDFCEEKKLSGDTYVAAILSDIADTVFLNSYLGQRAARALAVAGDRMNRDSRQFLGGLLGDRKKLYDFWSPQMAELYADDPEMGEFAANLGETEAIVPSRVWRAEPKFIAPEILNDNFVRRANVETLLIAGGRNLHTLYQAREDPDPDRHRTANVLQNMLQAETFLAPLIEIMGMQGFAMAISSAAIRTRLENSGQGQRIDQAKKFLAQYGSHNEVVRQTHQMMLDLTDEKLSHGLPVNYSDAHHVLVGAGDIDLTGEDLRFMWRRKTLGGIAQKGSNLMDFIGGTLISPDECALDAIFAHFVKRVRDNHNFTPKSSPSRRQPIHVRGTDSFREKIVDNLRSSGVLDRDIDQKRDDRAMNLAKMTFLYGARQMPVEIQVMTEAVRLNMLIGEASHFGYRLRQNMTADDLAALREIHDVRAPQIATPNLYPPLIGDSDVFWRNIDDLAT